MFIDTTWWIAHLPWIALGVVTGLFGFFFGFAAASVMAVSGGISQWEESQPQPKQQEQDGGK